MRHDDPTLDDIIEQNVHLFLVIFGPTNNWRQMYPYLYFLDHKDQTPHLIRRLHPSPQEPKSACERPFHIGKSWLQPQGQPKFDFVPDLISLDIQAFPFDLRHHNLLGYSNIKRDPCLT